MAQAYRPPVPLPPLGKKPLFGVCEVSSRVGIRPLAPPLLLAFSLPLTFPFPLVFVEAMATEEEVSLTENRRARAPSGKEGLGLGRSHYETVNSGRGSGPVVMQCIAVGLQPCSSAPH